MFDEFSDAVSYGDLDKVKELIEADPAIVNSKDEYGFTALHNVMSEEQPETIAYLIENGADVNSRNEAGTTPLHLACYPENAKFLIDAGADINAKDNQGNTPLHTLASDGQERIDVAEYLLDRGADKTLRNNAGKLAYDISVSREDDEMVQLLM